jgi:hypothetical protein
MNNSGNDSVTISDIDDKLNAFYLSAEKYVEKCGSFNGLMMAYSIIKCAYDRYNLMSKTDKTDKLKVALKRLFEGSEDIYDAMIELAKYGYLSKRGYNKAQNIV